MDGSLTPWTRGVAWGPTGVVANYIWRRYDQFRWNDLFVSDAAGNFVRDFTSRTIER